MPKILIVENSAESRDSLVGRLQCRGFEVVTADDGTKGIAMVQTEKPDLILTDANMPEMDGWETSRQIKAAEGGACPPVIALIQDPMPGDVVQPMEVACADSHSKSIDFTDLLKQIEAILQARPMLEIPLKVAAEGFPECL